MDKKDLLSLLKDEEARYKKRIRRHEDVMSDSQMRELEARVDAIRFAIASAEKLVAAA